MRISEHVRRFKVYLASGEVLPLEPVGNKPLDQNLERYLERVGLSRRSQGYSFQRYTCSEKPSTEFGPPDQHWNPETGDTRKRYRVFPSPLLATLESIAPAISNAFHGYGFSAIPDSTLREVAQEDPIYEVMLYWGL